jgi:hypothetical protein
MGKNFLDQRDNGALKLLSNYMPDRYFPYTQNSIKPYSLLAFVNDIIINDRKTIVEFGAGISTIVIANMIEQHQLDKQLISFEHDANWIKIVESYIKSDAVKIHHVDVNDKAPFTYNEDKIKPVLDKLSIDSVLVDGPPAYNWERRRSRRPVIDLFKSNLNPDRHCVFLDDVNRPSEYKSIKQWGKTLGAKGQTVNNCIGYVIKGNHYSFK